MTDSVMLAYNTPLGRADYIGGSGLVGEPQYTLRGRTLSHAAVCALSSRKNRRGRNVPARDKEREGHMIDHEQLLNLPVVNCCATCAFMRGQVDNAWCDKHLMGVLAYTKCDDFDRRAHLPVWVICRKEPTDVLKERQRGGRAPP